MSKGSDYYGGYFWVAAISFIVPLFVGWKAFENAQATTKPEVQLDASGVDHKVWDYLLKNYVKGGLVDYDGMKKNYLFRDYIRQIGSCQPDRLETEDAKLALACNAYNALVIDGVITYKIKDSVMDHKFDESGKEVHVDPEAKPKEGEEKEKLSDFFGTKVHYYAGKTIALNDLEHKMIRPVFKEPRVHVALVCAAKSCPSIRAEAYTAERVRDQLQDQSVQFANNSKYVTFGPVTKDGETKECLQLSSILDWYGSDFDEKYPDGSYLQWIKESTDDPKIKDACEKAIKKEVEVSFIEYDWSLNSQSNTGPKKSGGFGSGSSPDE